MWNRSNKIGTHRRGKSIEKNDPFKDPKEAKTRPLTYGAFKAWFIPGDKKKEDDYNRKIQALKDQLRDNNIPGFEDSNIHFALDSRYADGDVTRAYEMLLLMRDAAAGVVRPYNPAVPMVGAENRGGVTCYLDALLFAMFARIPSYEPLLRQQFDDEPRKRLVTLLCLWVNMLRTGKMIHIDIVERVQDALKVCGWDAAALVQQQDTSEAYGFITDTLQLPLITMEMDIFHEGKDDDPDDHRIVNERVLEVAVPESRDGRPVRLEDCLEEHLNVKVELLRKLQSILQVPPAPGRPMNPLETVSEQGVTVRVEEIGEPVASPIAMDDHDGPAAPNVFDGSTSSPRSMGNTSPVAVRPPGRGRAPSIIRHVVVMEEEDDEPAASEDGLTRTTSRKASIRKEVMMPAWQFFRIIPWYTSQKPENDAQVAQFASTRPILAICLKRYGVHPNGEPYRQNTAVDIPLQISLPHFIKDDSTGDDAPLFGNFYLLLQSVVCHRGNSVQSGHYITFSRAPPKPAEKDSDGDERSSDGDELPEYREDRWMRFDDLDPQNRVAYVDDIEKALKEEMPYLLFYQVRPICPDEPEDDGTAQQPPSYQTTTNGSGVSMNGAGVSLNVKAPTPVLRTGPAPFTSSPPIIGYFENRPTTVPVEVTQPRISFSDDAERPRASLNLPDSSRRGSLAWTDVSNHSVPSGAVTPIEDAQQGLVQQGRVSRHTSIFGRRDKSKTRQTSQAEESRGLSALTKIGQTLAGGRTSKEFGRVGNGEASNAATVVTNVNPPVVPQPLPTPEPTEDPVPTAMHVERITPEPSPLDRPAIEAQLNELSDKANGKKGKGKAKYRVPKLNPPERTCTMM